MIILAWAVLAHNKQVIHIKQYSQSFLKFHSTNSILKIIIIPALVFPNKMYYQKHFASLSYLNEMVLKAARTSYNNN